MQALLLWFVCNTFEPIMLLLLSTRHGIFQPFLTSCQYPSCVCISYQLQQCVCVGVHKYVWETLSTYISISLEWSLKEVDKLKMFLGENPSEGSVIPFLLSSSDLSQQWITGRCVSLWRPTEMLNFFQYSCVMFIYCDSGSMRMKPLQK